MKLSYYDKSITGILTVVPAYERKFVDDMVNFNFSEARSLKLKEVMGYDRHRIVNGHVCSSDLAIHGLEHLLKTNRLSLEEIDALVVVTQSPDYLMPATSSVIHGRLGLHQDVFCVDINQGCAGFIIGLMQSFMLLDQLEIRKVVLINVDVLSRKVSSRDRNSFPLIGDAASITIVENRPGAGDIKANLKMDGTRREALIIPAGGFANPSNNTTAELVEDSEGNSRALDHLKMDGSGVFNFVMTEVPELIKDLLLWTKTEVSDIDTFLFHQPNRFMLQKLADKLNIPRDKMPSNIVESFGNSSGVTIPLAATYNLSNKLLYEEQRICFSGFGVGLTWGAMLANLGPLQFCEMVEY